MRQLLALIAGETSSESLDDKDWHNTLDLADRTQTTQMLREVVGLPPWVRDEIHARIAKIAQRRTRLLETYRDVAQALAQGGIDYVLIKGFTHEVDAGWDVSLRIQCDVDVFCQQTDISAAQDALLKCGFVFHSHAGVSDIHAWPLLKPHSWKWKGDYFDPLQPVPVDVHPSIWNATRERIAAHGLEAFWDRRERMDAAGLQVPAFCDVDRLAVAALHLLRHTLRNEVQVGHAWELSRMLALRAHDEGYWEKWKQLHPGELRRLEVIAFKFACNWFGEPMPALPREDWDALPADVHAWFERFAFSPMENLTKPNKDVVWLHLALIPGIADRFAIARQRLFPIRLPESGAVPQGSYVGHLAARSLYHTRALAGALWSGARWAATRSKTLHTPD